jgi:hypothetical protein
MVDQFSSLAVLTIASHGDARERDVWSEVAGELSNYEMFWRELIVMLTNRIVPVLPGKNYRKACTNLP